jgi:ABC-type nitrate/sulfonate/bicarbonate transport system permease component
VKDEEIADSELSYARSAGFWILSVAVGCVIIILWEPVLYRLGAENLSASHPSAMGSAMFAVILSERLFRKGVSDSGWADVAQSILYGAGIGAILALLAGGG